MWRINDIKKLLISKKSTPILCVMLIVGITLILLSDTKNDFNENTDDYKTEEVTQITENQDNVLDVNLEQELKNILSLINGVGKVDVLINYKTTSEKIVLKENEGSSDEKTVTVGDASDSKPFIKKENAAEIEGVIIVAEGGGEIDVQVAVSEAVSAVLNLPIHKIKVLKMKG